MPKCDRGFTYPLTLAVLLAISATLAAASELLLVEARMVNEIETIQTQEYYMVSSLKKIEKSLNEGSGAPASGSFAYRKGLVAYTVSAASPGTLKATISVKVDGSVPVEGYGYYDITLKKMVKWVEKN
ncbi:competence type IV pilus minor pilin ComGG [Bacillus sp. FJAT-27245]|uniref:competence type IV pilus minor pilin ComGG n=1 Tax=Bacillus sp. FJAT-27245 TaxID=1684144 RepID=UPI0006A7BB1C|nr:competence type IV pilus minor pilin ComGG [Bacillus sp. FJAT-27245]